MCAQLFADHLFCRLAPRNSDDLLVFSTWTYQEGVPVMEGRGAIDLSGACGIRRDETLNETGGLETLVHTSPHRGCVWLS